MNKQVDVKAILSHIVRGDGLNKCRICMGETTEGQVSLSDTVMMDGNKPISLSELLEIITGIQVEESRDLPDGICSICTTNALTACHFKRLCNESHKHWSKAAVILSPINISGYKSVYIKYDDGNIIQNEYSLSTLSKAVERLNDSGNKKQIRQKPRKRRILKCNDCGKRFNFVNTLNKHLKNTTKRICRLCSKIVHKSKLMKHLKACHNKTVYHCETCYQLFTTQLLLLNHTLVSHKDVSCQCRICGFGFKSDRSLAAHMYSHTLFNCSLCNASFENRRCHRHHILGCKGSKNSTQSSYECDHCGLKYGQKPSLKTHIMLKHLNVLQYVCQFCGKRSSTLAHHKAHETIHLTKRQIYQCYCGAKMRTVLGFRMHQRIHSGEKPYECNECGERFLSASRRLDHVKRKHAKEAHACDKCGAKFVRPFQLKKHYQVHLMEALQ